MIRAQDFAILAKNISNLTALLLTCQDADKRQEIGMLLELFDTNAWVDETAVTHAINDLFPDYYSQSTLITIVASAHSYTAEAFDQISQEFFNLEHFINSGWCNNVFFKKMDGIPTFFVNSKVPALSTETEALLTAFYQLEEKYPSVKAKLFNYLSDHLIDDYFIRNLEP